jgi:hypothetical protein
MLDRTKTGTDFADLLQLCSAKSVVFLTYLLTRASELKQLLISSLSSQTARGPISATPGGLYEHLDNIICGPASGMDRRIYRIPRGRRPDSSFVGVCGDLPDIAFRFGSTHGLTRSSF